MADIFSVVQSALSQVKKIPTESISLESVFNVDIPVSQEEIDQVLSIINAELGIQVGRHDVNGIDTVKDAIDRIELKKRLS